MRPVPLSTCEHNFLLRSLEADQRVDGRSCEEFRELRIILGSERGACLTYLGNTKVFAQVSAELSPPKPGRPNEGTVFVNLDMSPMAAPNFEVGRLGESGIEVCRLLERLLKECHCVDTESLCVQSGKQVWHIRVDVHLLDNDGSIIDCASVAAVTALLHFRRPDVTVIGENVVVHSTDEKEPVPLNLYHQPVAVSFGFLKEGRGFVADPREREEKVMEGSVIVGMNSRREVCALHCTGGLVVVKSEILRCTAKALQRALSVIDKIKAVILEDSQKRSSGVVIPGFVDQICTRAERGMETTQSPSFPCDVAASSAEPFCATAPMEIHSKGQSVQLGENAERMMNERESEEDVKILQDISHALTDQLVPPSKEKPTWKGKKKKSKFQNNSDVSKLLDEIEADVQMSEPKKDATEELRCHSPEIVEEIDLTAAVKVNKKKKRQKKLI